MTLLALACVGWIVWRPVALRQSNWISLGKTSLSSLDGRLSPSLAAASSFRRLLHSLPLQIRLSYEQELAIKCWAEGLLFHKLPKLLPRISSLLASSVDLSCFLRLHLDFLPYN